MKISRNIMKSVIPFIVGLLSWVLIEAHLLTGSALLVIQLILFLTVILVIWEGSNLLVDSSQEIAQHFHVSPFLIGLTIVAFGTSVPELVTSLVAGIGGKGDIAVANVVGSNILNISVILGGLALFTKGGLAINKQTIKLDAPLLILGTLLILLFIGQTPVETQIYDGLKQYGFLNLKLDFLEAAVLLTGFILYLYIIITRRDKSLENSNQSENENIDATKKQKSLTTQIMSIIAGLAFVMLGCHVLVGEVNIVDGVVRGFGAVWFASIMGVPDYLVGLSIVALGTSAPEIVVSLSAVRSNAIDVGIGNLLGSAIFNTFAVLGLAGLLIQPPLAESISIHSEAIQSIVVMGLIFIMLSIFLTTSQRLSRREGLVLFSAGVAFLIYEMIANMPQNSL